MYGASDWLAAGLRVAGSGKQMRQRVVAAWQFALPCTTFSQLRRPRLSQPAGFDLAEACAREGNVLARFTGMALHLIDECQVGVLVQPGGSTMRHLAIMQRLRDRGFAEARFDVCVFGAPFRKATSWLGNIQWPAFFEQRCSCREPPVRIGSSLAEIRRRSDLA